MEMDILSSIAGAGLSLTCSYAPGARQWYGSLDGTRKRLVMVGLLLLAAVVVLVLACSGLAAEFGLQATCDRTGIVALVRAFFMLAVVNQATFLLTPAPTPTISQEPVYEDIA